MRADRLLAMLSLLQARGRLTAHRLAAELEVSERTIYRDVEALSTAGIPIYAERGPGGGVELLEQYRSDLTGLNPAEVQALFMLSIPAPLGDLGLAQELKAALLKLSAALPASRRQEEAYARQRIHLDPAPWGPAEQPAPFLAALHQAVWNDHPVQLAYQPYFRTTIRQQVNPYGLVAKAGQWFLVAAYRQRLRVYRLAQITDVQVEAVSFTRQPGFDLAAFWQAWQTGRERESPAYPVKIRLAPALQPDLPQIFGRHFTLEARKAPGGPPGWIHLELVFETLEEARARLLPLGGAVEVLTPAALRLSLADYARQIVQRYESDQDVQPPGARSPG